VKKERSAVQDIVMFAIVLVTFALLVACIKGVDRI
jgi:hypothetical protein